MYIIQEELTMQRQLIRLFYEENCKKKIFMFGTKLEVAFHSKVQFAFKGKCSRYAFKYGLNVFKLKILFKIHFIAQHNKRKEIKKYSH